jgi:hypothetical protein
MKVGDIVYNTKYGLTQGILRLEIVSLSRDEPDKYVYMRPSDKKDDMYTWDQQGIVGVDTFVNRGEARRRVIELAAKKKASLLKQLAKLEDKWGV